MVVANPPFSLKDWGADKWATDPHKRALGGVPPKGNADFAWVQHMLASMKPKTGRVGVVMPHGVLFRSGQEAKIRQYLIKSDQLETVIGLAPNLFYGTAIPASLLIFRAEKFPKNKKHVLFIDASKRFTKGRNQNTLENNDVADIHSIYLADGDEEHDKISSRLVAHKEIEENNWDLNIGRYLKTEAVEAIDVAFALQQLNNSLRILTIAEQEMLKRLKAAGYA
jgi:type I restriction enzyme M protein